MSITLTGPMAIVPIETIGRRTVYQFGQLDQIQCAFLGPDFSIDQFPINSPHLVYPLMFVTGAQATAIEGGLTQLTVNYEGKKIGKGVTSFVTDPITSETNVQGGRDFTEYVITQMTPAVFGSGTGAGSYSAPTYNYGSQSVQVRYIGTQCSIRYQAYPRPTGLKYSTLGLSRVKSEVISTVKGVVSIIGSGVSYDMAAQAISYLTAGGTGVPPIYARNMGFEREQRGKWYNCTEIYGPSF